MTGSWGPHAQNIVNEQLNVQRYFRHSLPETMQCICISIYACSGMCYLFSTDLMFTKHPMHLEIGITTKIKTLVMVFKLFIHAITPVITTSYNSTCTSQAHAYASLTVCTGHGAKVYIYCEIESLYSCLLIFLLLFVNILAS